MTDSNLKLISFLGSLYLHVLGLIFMQGFDARLAGKEFPAFILAQLVKRYNPITIWQNIYYRHYYRNVMKP